MSYNLKPAQRILVISPHADDEVIGCGGLIALASEAGVEVTVIVMTTGGVKHCHLTESANTSDRIAEFKACARWLGVCRAEVLFSGKDMQLETIPMLELVTSLDTVLNGVDYDECYIPDQSHNIDHRITYEAALAALRPGARRSPSLVATYEGTIAWWPHMSLGGIFVDISTAFERKINGLKEYRSQLRPYPHPISAEAVSRLAAFRGMECGVRYAERFQVIRMMRN